MQLSLEKLRTLSEADLRRIVLLPLFRAMGFSDVTEVHGSRELGKDIVMWKEDPVQDRINYAVVVKAQQVKTGARSTDVARQIRESLGSAYTDPISLEEKEIHRVIVAASQGFTSEAKDSIKSELKSSGLAGRVSFLDGERLFERVRKHLPEAVIWDPLKKASEALKAASQNWDFTLQVGPDGVSSLYVTDRPGALAPETVKGSMTLQFPATPEGMQKRAEYQRYLETGTPVELTAENIHTFEIPEFFRNLAPEGEVTNLFLGPSGLGEVMLRRLLVLDKSDQILFSLDYVHFTHRQGGTKEFSLDNRAQPIPFRLRLGFNKETKESSFYLNFETKDTNVLQYLRWLQLRRAMAEGHRLVFIDWITGLTEMGTPLKGFSAPESLETELAEQLVFIQGLTKTAITLADNGFFSLCDLENAKLGYQILSNGQAQLPFSISFSSDDPLTWEKKIGERVTFPIVEKDFALEILGSKISFGEAHILCRGILRKIAPEEKSEHLFRVEASAENPSLAAFPRWLPQSSEDQKPAVEENTETQGEMTPV